jgi:SAM-dependent methyltransferase
MGTGRFESLQRDYTREADPDHYAWQTGNSYFAETERRLLDGLELGAHESLLEIGCGEGGNLHHLRGRGRLRLGLDFSANKARFAATHSQALALCGDATHLPIADDSFDVILIRDLLHHVNDRAAVLRQAQRVLKPHGRLTLIEPNALSPLILLQAALVPAERGVMSSTAARLQRELEEAGFRVRDHHVCQPLPLGRVLLHPKLALGERFARVVPRMDAAMARLMPRRTWMYLIYQAEKA